MVEASPYVCGGEGRTPLSLRKVAYHQEERKKIFNQPLTGDVHCEGNA